MKCEVCGQEFAESDEPELILHMKREHPTAGDEGETPDKTPEEPGRAESDRDQLEPAQRGDR
jgi:hypothetical protein